MGRPLPLALLPVVTLFAGCTVPDADVAGFGFRCDRVHTPCQDDRHVCVKGKCVHIGDGSLEGEGEGEGEGEAGAGQGGVGESPGEAGWGVEGEEGGPEGGGLEGAVEGPPDEGGDEGAGDFQPGEGEGEGNRPRRKTPAGARCCT